MKPPFEVLELDHVVLRVRDINASQEFYERILGCPLVRVLKDLGLYQFRVGRHLVDLVPIGTRLGGSTEPIAKARNMDHFCLIIEPFDSAALLEYLQNNQVKIVAETGIRYGAEGYGPSLYISDPDGHTIELKGAGGTDHPE